MEVIRNCYIDNIRGFATISVVYIHTVFWSGGSYVPDILRHLALFIDVPIFFLLTGLLFADTKKLNPIKQIIKLITYFTVSLLILQIVFNEYNLNNIYLSLTMNNVVFDLFPVLSGSYWFVPVYAVSTILAYGLISEFKKFSIFFIIFSLFYYVFSYFSGYTLINYNFLGVSLNFLLFYTSCILFGYHSYKFHGNKNWIFLTIFSFLSLILLYIYNNISINLQNSKFPVGLPYIIASTISMSLILLFKKPNFNIPIITFIGKNSIFFYISQGFSSSLIFYLLPIININWPMKLIILFSVNLFIAIIIGYLMIYIIKFFKEIMRIQ